MTAPGHLPAVPRADFDQALRLLGLDPDDPQTAIIGVRIAEGRIHAELAQTARVGGRVLEEVEQTVGAPEPEPAEQPAEPVRSWRWDGGAELGYQIIAWINEHGGTARYIHEYEPLLAWFEQLADPDDAEMQPYDDHEFFTGPRWTEMFWSGGAVYQISRPFLFQRGEYATDRHELICHVSAKYVPADEFLDWIAPWLDHRTGDFLGYTLYEDSRPSAYQYGRPEGPDREQPTLLYMP